MFSQVNKSPGIFFHSQAKNIQYLTIGKFLLVTQFEIVVYKNKISRYFHLVLIQFTYARGIYYVVFFINRVPQSIKQNPNTITLLSVVSTNFVKIMWRYQVEINIKHRDLQFFGVQNTE